MAKVTLEDRIENLKKQREQTVQQANQTVAYITGQIELLEEMLSESEAPEEGDSEQESESEAPEEGDSEQEEETETESVESE